MNRAVLVACLPWLGVLVILLAVACLLVRLSRSRPQLSRVLRLHGDQEGAAQSLSFVLTLPIFVMVLMLIVQVSQLMVGTVVVHYAAYAAARAAIVWIPAATTQEAMNCIGDGTFSEDPDATNNVMPTTDPTAANYGPSSGGMSYLVTPAEASTGTDPTGVGFSDSSMTPKLCKILSAAVLGCLPMAPSRNVGLSPPGNMGGYISSTSLSAAYDGMVTHPTGNPANDSRLQNKLAWAGNHTRIEIRFYHQNQQYEPPLGCEMGEPYGTLFPNQFLNDPYPYEFATNEIGWQDTLTVTVHHDLALLPGPGRLLSLIPNFGIGGADKVCGPITLSDGNTYICPLTAKAMLGNEGLKSGMPYVYPLQ
jgi:Flp pilus assembly protein TadG